MRPFLKDSLALTALLLLALCNVHVLSAPAETKLQKLRLARAPSVHSESKDVKDEKGHGHDSMPKPHDGNQMKPSAHGGQSGGGGDDDEMAWYPIDDDDYRLTAEETNRGKGSGDGATSHQVQNKKEKVMSMTIDQLLDTVKDILDKGNKKGLSGPEVDKLSGVMSLLREKVHELEKKQKSCEEALGHSGISSGSETGNKHDKNVKEVEEHGNLEIKIYNAGGRAGHASHHVEQHEKKEEEEMSSSDVKPEPETAALAIGVYEPPPQPPSPPKTPSYFAMPPDVNYNGGINRHMDDMKQQWPYGHWPDEDNQGQGQGQMSMNAYYQDLNRNRNAGNLGVLQQLYNQVHNQNAGSGNFDVRQAYQIQNQNAGSGNLGVRQSYQVQNQNQNAGNGNYVRDLGVYVGGPAVAVPGGGGVAYYGAMTGAGAETGSASASDQNQNDFQVMNMQQHFLNANTNRGKVGKGETSRNMG